MVIMAIAGSDIKDTKNGYTVSISYNEDAAALLANQTVAQYDSNGNVVEKSIPNTLTASVMTPRGIVPNIKTGDVVVVSINENHITSPVVLGVLYSKDVLASLKDKKQADYYPDAKFNNLDVTGDTNLSEATTIGNVKPENIKHLEGADRNIKAAIDTIELVFSEAMDDWGTSFNTFSQGKVIE